MYNCSAALPTMKRIIRRVTMGSFLARGDWSSRSSFGGSVASASDANESMIMFTCERESLRAESSHAPTASVLH